MPRIIRLWLDWRRTRCTTSACRGVGPGGSLYRSEFSLRTLPASGPPDSPNLAAGARFRSEQPVRRRGRRAFAAIRAIAGDPSTRWSSDGDGDGAWIEIELPGPTQVIRVGFWTRTMGSSAQILSFRIVSDRGDLCGPFPLTDAAQIHYFDVDLISLRLRLEAVETSGGNTGAVEIEVYGDPEGNGGTGGAARSAFPGDARWREGRRALVRGPASASSNRQNRKEVANRWHPQFT
jgi:hypothetical protein